MKSNRTFRINKVVWTSGDIVRYIASRYSNLTQIRYLKQTHYTIAYTVKYIDKTGVNKKGYITITKYGEDSFYPTLQELNKNYL